ncbi:MAG: glycosyltransferase family 4 protein [Anaerolineales bacterium]
MRLLFVADGRSPIALQWIRYFVQRGDEVYLASTFPAAADLPLKGVKTIAIAFSHLAGSRLAGSLSSTPSWRTHLRHWLAPLTIPFAARRLRQWAEEIRPDLIHALRIPYEGMITAGANLPFPWIVSVWGNDFTLHAPASPLLRAWTRSVLKNTHALHADCQRDIRLAHHWGLPPERATLVIPGNGGVERTTFFPPAAPVLEPIIIHPRGLRAYVRNDLFFRAAQMVTCAEPGARFLCVGMAGHVAIENLVRSSGLQETITLLPSLPHAQMADLYRQAAILISPSVHDGTPNSLLEGMACGCFPVAGDLESIREWIEMERNGLLYPPTDAQAMADALLHALRDPALRQRAREYNIELIARRADYHHNMEQAVEFYRQVIKN